MSVKRYRLDRNRDYISCISEVDEGAFIRIQADEFVRASDYDALAQVNAELLEALKRVKETRVFIGAIAQGMMDNAIARAAPEVKP